MLTTTFTELVGCRSPIQQAPMGPVSPPALAVAVARAGGLGSVSVMPGTPIAALTAQLAELTAGDPGALAVNFLTDGYDLQAVRAAAERVRVVDFFWNTPATEPVRVAHAAGALVNWQVGSLADARAALAAGVDMLTVQGTEAGGHVRGHTALLPLLSAVLAETNRPVLAAGAICDGRTLAAVLAAGAAGARIGTRFVAAAESGAHPDYVAALLAAGEDATAITDSFDRCPLCASLARTRVLRSAVTQVAELGEQDAGTMLTPDGEAPIPARSGMPPHRAVRGRVAAMALYAGEGVGAVDRVSPAAEIVADLCAEAEDRLRTAAGLGAATTA